MVASLWYFTPFLLVSIVVCAVFRGSRWIAPYWVFAVCPVMLLFITLLAMLFQTLGIHGPDGGFVGMGTGFILLFSLFEVVPGIVLLLVFPRGGAWGSHAVAPCLFAGAVSLAACLVAVPHLPRFR